MLRNLRFPSSLYKTTVFIKFSHPKLKPTFTFLKCLISKQHLMKYLIDSGWLELPCSRLSTNYVASLMKTSFSTLLKLWMFDRNASCAVQRKVMGGGA